VELHGSIVFFFLPRLSKLLRELGVERGNKMIIFVETKKKVDDIKKGYSTRRVSIVFDS